MSAASRQLRFKGYATKNHKGGKLSATGHDRFFLSHGFHVFYFEDESMSNRKGHFDLRKVTAIEPYLSQDELSLQIKSKKGPFVVKMHDPAQQAPRWPLSLLRQSSPRRRA